MRKIRIILLMLIYLSAHKFFNPFGLVTEQMGKAMFYAFSLLGILWAVRYGKKIQHTKPMKYYWWIVGGIVVSVFSVWMNYDQTFPVSLMTTLPYLFAYLYFYVLQKFAIEKEFLMDSSSRYLKEHSDGMVEDDVVRNDICEIIEGGEDAFQKCALRYEQLKL